MKQALLLLSVLCLGACAWNQANSPVLSPQAAAVRIVLQMPPADCTLKGSILGDQNANPNGWFVAENQLASEVQINLKNRAAVMGGNTVWLYGANWPGPQASLEYSTPLYVSGVKYEAAVYDCPVAVRVTGERNLKR